MYSRAADTSGASVVLPCRDHAIVGAAHANVLRSVTHFDRLATGARTILDESPEAQPALGFMLRLAQEAVCRADLAALTDGLLDRFAHAFDTRPWLTTYLLDTLPGRLARRAPWESVEDVCHSLLGASALRDLERSVARSEGDGALPETCRYGSAWHRHFCQWRQSIVDAWQDFLLLGCGARAPDDSVRMTLTSPPPTGVLTLDFGCAGATGYALGILYASSVCHATCPDLPPSRPFQRRYRSPTLDIDVAHPAARTCAFEPNVCVAQPTQPILSRLEDIVGKVEHFVMETAVPVIGHLPYALDRLLFPPPLMFPTAAADLPATSIPNPVRSAALTPPSAFPAMSASPELERLINTAQFWRHRTATHHALYDVFSPLLMFSPSPSEAELLRRQLANVTEFVGFELNDLRLRRHAPADHWRIKQVTYWSLHDGAERVRDRRLNIGQPPEGVSFDISPQTRPGAVYESPTVMTADRFERIVALWDSACRARAARTWQPPADFETIATSHLTNVTVTTLALSDLALTYINGQISNEAFYLAHAALSNTTLSKDPSAPTFLARRLELTIRRDGREYVAAPAGTCVIGKPSENDITLLYLQGDAPAWRAYSSHKAFIDAIDSDTLALRTTLSERLPMPLREQAAKGVARVTLRETKIEQPLQIATQATLDTIKADGALQAISPDTAPRIAQYDKWLSGASSDGMEQGLQTFRHDCHQAGIALPGRPIDITLDDVRRIARLEALRFNLSMAVPQMKRITRRHLMDRLGRAGFQPDDPDQIYVKLAHREAVPLTDAVLRSTSFDALWWELPLLVRDAGGRYRTIVPLNSPQASPTMASDVIDNTLTEGLHRSFNDAAAQFWETSRANVRKVLKSEFIAQVWLLRALRKMPVDQVHIAARVAGPIELARLDGDELAHEIVDPKVEREWLSINGMTTSLMRVSIAGRSPCLLIAPFEEGLRVYGFDDRGRMASWVREQLRNETSRARFFGTFVGQRPVSSSWHEKVELGAQRVSDARSVDTFTVVASAYEARQQQANATPGAPPTPHPLLAFMDTFSKVDIAFGLGTWFLPFARPASTVYSMTDAGFGLIGIGVGAALHDKDLFWQGWQCILSAIGAQGLSAANFRAKLLITGDQRYKYFVSDAPVAAQATIAGLHRVGDRFYAAIDTETRAYVGFDEATGFFRMTRGASSDVEDADAPLMRMSASGKWHLVSPSESAAPVLDDPHTAWRIDQAFRSRYARLRDARTADFDIARRSVTVVDTSKTTMPLSWQLRLLKLDFLNPAQSNPEVLGRLAGRIAYLQNAVDAAETVALSPMAEDARRLGATYLGVTQSPRMYVGHVRMGLLRACALVPYRYSIESMVMLFNQQARLVPEMSAWLVADLSQLGRLEIQYLDPPPTGPDVWTLDTVFAEQQDTSRAFEVRADARTLLLGRHIGRGGVAAYYLFDPANAIVIHPDPAVVLGLMRDHLSAIFEGVTPAVSLREIDLEWLADVRVVRPFTGPVPIRIALHI
ncbi:dermonecrotic toxin domain-containing protein [Pandoraea sputorum]|uniref:dermonecrotic toxin domain-containing protein n=1 Tax=Pandoraea sputorum TaxID=93222 RepID=UPI0030C74690